MRSTPITTYGRNWRRDRDRLEQCLAARLPFHISTRSLRGESGPVVTRGQLPAELVERYRDELNHAEYVVYSYSTPIVWVAWPGGESGAFTVPDVRYSSTTTHHQNMIRVAVRQFVEPMTVGEFR